MKKATIQLARRARSRRRTRRRHARAFEAASTECSLTPKKERGLYGAIAGAAAGLVATAAGFFVVTAKNRELQAKAGAPAPKPGFAAAIAAAGAMTAGAFAGRYFARKKPTC